MKDTMNKVKRFFATTGAGLVMMANRAMAASINDVIRPFTNLNTLIEAILKGIGGVLLLWYIGQFALSIMQNDAQGKQSALKGIAGGAILVSAGFVLQFILS